jgi:HTH DNA binding domain
MVDDTPFDDEDATDARLRPPWEDTPDETDADCFPSRRHPSPSGDDGWRAGADLPVLLTALADASDALARLDARVATAARAVSEGLRARLALTEAAGFLAHTQAWVHPLDLALRDAGLTAPAALAALGAGARALPHTIAQPAGRLGWEDPPLETLPAADQGVADALALARLLRRLPGGGPHPFGSAAATAATLTALGARHLDPGRLAAWWDAHAPASPPRRRFGARRGAARAPHPPLLAGAVAAQAWMESGIIDQADPMHALLAAFGRLVRQPPARSVFVPVWSAYPAVGFGDRDALPTLRSDAADRLVGWGRMVTWPVTCLHLIAESARLALRELDRLEAAASAKGRGALAGTDRRSRLPDALDALLRAPVLTPKSLAAQLRIVPQTATALLRTLQAEGVVREVTGRGSFRAFAV